MYQGRSWTYDELVDVLSETNRPTELWEGELKISPAPAPKHQRIVARLFRHLDDFVTGHEAGEVFLAPVDVVLDQLQTVQPDIVFVAKRNERIVQDAIRGIPDLVMEVVSKGSRQLDRVKKKALYEKFGIKEYWIVDPEAETIEVLGFSEGSNQLIDKAGFDASAKSILLPGFSVLVSAVFT